MDLPRAKGAVACSPEFLVGSEAACPVPASLRLRGRNRPYACDFRKSRTWPMSWMAARKR